MLGAIFHAKTLQICVIFFSINTGPMIFHANALKICKVKIPYVGPVFSMPTL
jgi:hypothetical protein